MHLMKSLIRGYICLMTSFMIPVDSERVVNRHLIFYSNTKMDICVKEVPDELMTDGGIPFLLR